MKKLIAMLGAVVAAVTSAFAATPVAKWCGSDFTSTQNGLTMSLNGNTVSGGAVVIGSNGLKISWTGTNPFGTNSNTQFFQALVRYADVPVPGNNDSETVMVSLTTTGKNGDYLGTGVIAGGKVRGIWNDNDIYGNSDKGNDSNVANLPGINTFVMSYTRKTNAIEGYNTTTEGVTAFVNGAISYGNTGLKAGYTVQDIIIGGRAGSKTKFAPATGMKVLGVALFNEPLTVAEMNSFKFDNEADTIEISEDTDWSSTDVDGKALTISVSGTPTLTLGAAKAPAAIKVIGDGTLTIADAQNLTVASIVGSNINLQYTGTIQQPNNTTKAALTGSTWSGTVTLKNVTVGNVAAASRHLYLESFGGVNSKIVLDGVSGWWLSASQIPAKEIEIVGDGLTIKDGSSGAYTTFKKVTGNGPIVCTGGSTQGYVITDGSEYRGAVDASTKAVSFGSVGRNGNSPNTNKIFVDGTVTVDKAWTATAGIVINGTLNLTANGSLPTASGTGTIVAEGKIPNNAGLAAEGWTGKLLINNDFLSCASTQIGNANSTLEIAAGKTLKLTNVAELAPAVVIGEGAKLILAKEDSDVYSVNIGSVRDFSTIGTVEVPDGKELTYVLTQTKAEKIACETSVSGAPTGATIKLGDLTAVVNEDGNATIKTGVKVDGDVCLFDIVFNHLQDGAQGANKDNATMDYKAVSATFKYDTLPTFSALTEEGEATADTGAYIKHHPYIDGAASTFASLTDFTTVVVGTMSPTANTQFIHFGSCYDGRSGVLIATADEKDKVKVFSNAGATLKEITTLTVPNASTARHVYVITKTDTETESVFTVYLDGVKRATVPMGTKIALGTSNHSGVQVGSSFGGSLNNGTYKSVAVNNNETGVINVLRVYDYILTWDQISKLTTDYPYVAEGGLYQRTIGAEANYSEDNSWTKAGAETAEFAVPTSAKEGFDPSFEITASEASVLTVNATASIETATTNGGKTTFKKDGDNKITISDSFLVNNQVVVEYGAVDMSGALVSLRDENCTLEIDMTDYEIPLVMETTVVPLTGEVRETDNVAFTLPQDQNHRHVAVSYESGRYVLTTTVETLAVTIPTVEGANAVVTVNGASATIAEGKVTIPYNAEIVVTYTAQTGRHIVGAVNSITASDVTEDALDASAITTAINVYDVKVMVKENSIAHVLVDNVAFGDYTETTTIQMNHGSRFDVSYTAAEGYTISGQVDGYCYGSVTENKGDYTLGYEVAPAQTPAEKFVADIAAGGTVELTSDIEITETIVVDGTVTLNLGSSTITSTVAPLFKVTGALTINGGTLAGPTGAEGAALDGESMITVVGGTLTYNSGTLTCGGSGSDGMYGVSVHDEGVAVFGTETAGPSISSHFAAVGANNTTAPVTITINNGMYTSAATTDTAWWFYFCTAVYAPGSGDITINGGTFTGKYGVYTRYSNVEQNLTINGGTFNSTATDIGIDTKIGSGYVGSGIRTITIGANELSIPEGYIVSEGKVVVKPTDLPGAEEVPADQKDAYNTWAAENGITTETTAADATTAATAFVMGVTVAEGQTIAKAAALKADEMLKEIATTEGVDLAALLAQAQEAGADGLVVETEKTNLTVKLVPTTLGEGVQTSAKLFKLSITIKK